MFILWVSLPMLKPPVSLFDGLAVHLKCLSPAARNWLPPRSFSRLCAAEYSKNLDDLCNDRQIRGRYQEMMRFASAKRQGRDRGDRMVLLHGPSCKPSCSQLSLNITAILPQHQHASLHDPFVAALRRSGKNQAGSVYLVLP
jgi:hypothetical protein